MYTTVDNGREVDTVELSNGLEVSVREDSVILFQHDDPNKTTGVGVGTHMSKEKFLELFEAFEYAKFIYDTGRTNFSFKEWKNLRSIFER